MKTIERMKQAVTRRYTGVFCAVLALASAGPTYADKACSASLNLKDCVSSIDLNTVSYTGGTLMVSGVLRAINSGATQGRILSVVANLQTKEANGNQYTTIATVGAPCGGTGLLLGVGLPLAVPGGPAQVCGRANQKDIPFRAAFSGVSLTSGKGARLELMVTFDGATNGSAGEFCGATPNCGSRIINVRFGFVVP